MKLSPEAKVQSLSSLSTATLKGVMRQPCLGLPSPSPLTFSDTGWSGPALFKQNFSSFRFQLSKDCGKHSHSSP